MSRRGVSYRRRCERCLRACRATSRSCCGWYMCGRCADVGVVCSRRGEPLCSGCVRFRMRLDKPTMRLASESSSHSYAAPVRAAASRLAWLTGGEPVLRGERLRQVLRDEIEDARAAAAWRLEQVAS